MRNRGSTLFQINQTAHRAAFFTLRANRMDRFGRARRSYIHESARSSALGFEGNEQ